MTTRRPLVPEAAWLPTAVLSVGAFTTVVNATLLSPLLTPISLDLGVSEAVAGQLSTMTAASAAAGALLVAPFLDRAPRRLWLQLECVVLAVGTLLSAVAPSLGWLFAGRAVAGLGGAFIFGICLATVGDLFLDPAHRNRAVALVGTAATLGAVVGLPLVTQIEAATSWRWSITGYLGLIGLLFAGTFLLPRTAPSGVIRGPGSWRAGWATGYRSMLANRACLRLQGGNVVISAVWFGSVIYLGAYARGDFGFGAGALTVLFVCAGAGEIVGGNLVPLALRRFAAQTVCVGAALALSTSLIGTAVLTGSGMALFPLVFVASLSSVALFTVVSILILDAAPRERGAAMTVMSAGFEVGGVVGVGGAGVALAVIGAYPPVYVLLGLIPLLALAPLAAGSRRPVMPATLRTEAGMATPRDGSPPSAARGF